MKAGVDFLPAFSTERQVPDNSRINGYNRRPLSELASHSFVDQSDRVDLGAVHSGYSRCDG